LLILWARFIRKWESKEKKMMEREKCPKSSMSRSDEKKWSGQYFWKKALCLTVIFVQYKKGLVIKKEKCLSIE